MQNSNPETPLLVLLIGGFGHAVWVFDEWRRDAAPVCLAGAVQLAPDEPLDLFLAHDWARSFTPSVFQDVQQALDAVKPDLVVVSTRPDRNPAVIEQCLRAGCHVIAEKPLAVDEAGLIRLHRAVCETGKFILPMLGMYETPAFAEARARVCRGEIGEPVLVNVRKSYQWGRRADWFADRATYGGIWSWVGIHAFNIGTYITGRRAVQVLAAQEQNRFHTGYRDCADVLSGLFLLENRVQMTVSIDLLRPDGQEAWGDDWCRIVGSSGSIEANPALKTIRLIRKGHDEEVRKVTAVAPPFYTAFLDAIKTDADFSKLTTLGFQLTDSALTADRASVEGLCRLDVNPGRWKIL
jgi:predicted dehydrogenase